MQKLVFSALARSLSDERGITAVIVALSLIALMGIAALAIDVGMLLTARTEAQRAADAGAMAGAGMLISAPGDDAAARNEAQDFATMNAVIGITPSVLDEDVEIIAGDRLRVSVRNTAERGNPIPTFFARVFNINAVDVGAVAAAEISGAGAADCLLPVALPDEWIDNGNEMWDPPPVDTYIPWPEPGYTGYGEDDIGRQIEIKTFETEDPNAPAFCQTSEAFDACNVFGDDRWKCWWRETPPNQGGGGGVETLDPLIRSCSTEVMELGETIYAASGSGNKQSLVQEAFADVVDSDPTAYWDESAGCAARPGEGCITSSPRMRRLPLIDPNSVIPDPIDGARTEATITNFGGVFIEKVSCSSNVGHKVGPAGRWNVYVRFMGFTGGNAIDRDDALLKTIRLVE